MNYYSEYPECVIANLEDNEPPWVLYYSVPKNISSGIFADGIKQKNKQLIHLHTDKQSAINAAGCCDEPYVFAINARDSREHGQKFYLYKNTWLTTSVKPCDIYKSYDTVELIENALFEKNNHIKFLQTRLVKAEESLEKLIGLKSEVIDVLKGINDILCSYYDTETIPIKRIKKLITSELLRRLEKFI